VIPHLRAVPPGNAQVAADPASPWILYFGEDLDTVALATAAVGCGFTIQGTLGRVVAHADTIELLRRELESRGNSLSLTITRLLDEPREWRLRTRHVPLEGGVVMGIVNLTDDSFSGDGVGRESRGALARAEELRSAGADIIDIGAETARADRPAIKTEAEARIVANAVTALVREGHVVSSDTYKGEVATAALDSGAEVVNDISGLTLGTAAAEQAGRDCAGYVLNYSYGVPKHRPHQPPVYEDVMAETVAWMFERVALLESRGLARETIAIDPGIAFGKSHDEDLQVIRRIGELRTLGLPILLAHSRKNFIGSISGRPPVDRDLETHIATAMAYERGVRIFRVHDVAGTRRALDVAQALASSNSGTFAPDGESWPWRAGAGAAHMASAESDKAPPAGQRW
jgi:dihydropteroate synthase